MSIIIQRPWTRQPPPRVGLNRGNPITNGIGAIAIPGQPEIISGAAQVVSGGFSVGPTSDGIAAIGPATQIAGYVGWDIPAVSIGGDFTIFMRLRAVQDESPFAVCNLELSGSLRLSGIWADQNQLYATLDDNATGTLTPDLTRMRSVVAVRRSNTAYIYVDGGGSSSGVTGTRTGSVTGLTIGRNRINANGNQTYVSLLGLLNRGWTDAEIEQWFRNPWQLFAPLPRRIWVPSAGGAAHASTGALASQAGSVSGTATHYLLHANTGALAAAAATASGSAAHYTLHTSTGALSSQAAAISGAAAHEHASTAALAVANAAIAGQANHLTLHTSTGALSSQAAEIIGAAAHEHAGTGALAAASAQIDGTAATVAGGTFNATGALDAEDAAIAGTALHLTLHTVTGALAAQASTVSGSAAHQHATTGSLAAQAGAMAGAATHYTLHTTSGALSAAAATIAGDAQYAAAGTHNATGAMVAQSSALSGMAVLTAGRRIALPRVFVDMLRLGQIDEDDTLMLLAASLCAASGTTRSEARVPELVD